MAWPSNPGAGDGADRAQQGAPEQLRVVLAGSTDMKAIRRSWPGCSAHGRSSDVLPLPASAEMIVTRIAAARSSAATRS
jgi:hypothetical protein